MRKRASTPALIMLLILLLVVPMNVQAIEPTQPMAEFSENWYGTKLTITVLGESTWEIGSDVPVKVLVTVKDMGDNQKVTFTQLTLELFGTGVMVTTPIDVSTTVAGEAFSKTVTLKVIDAFGLMAPGTTSTHSLTLTLKGSVVDKMGIEWSALTFERTPITVVAPQSPITIDAKMPSKVTVGEEFEVKLSIRNDGKYPISNLKIELLSPLLASITGPSDKIFEKLSPGEVVEAVFKLKAKTTGSEPISITFSYYTYWDYYVFDLHKTLGSVTIEQQRTGCLIATAAFGTELDPHVQYLRGFRDNLVMKTFAGSSFMKVFNAWYYSWAPYVATAELSYEPLRQAVKYALYPLIGILHVSVKIYDLLSFNPELGVTVAGIFISFMIGLVYFAPMVITASLILRTAPSRKIMIANIIVWLVTFGVTWLSITLQLHELVMIATSTLVLSTITLAIMFMMKGMNVLMRQRKGEIYYNKL